MDASKSKIYFNLFEDIIGQNSAIEILQSSLEKRKIAPAYLFTGPEGVGKKLTAIRFLEGIIKEKKPTIDIRKKLENRNHPDLMWIEPTYLNQGKMIEKSIANKENINRKSIAKIRLEQIKEVKRFLGNKPIEADLGMIIIEEVERMNESASNALLKTLEEPNNGIFLLISERPERLLNTIISRCQHIIFASLSTKNIEIILKESSKKLNIDISLGMKQKELINLSNGSPGGIIKNIQIWENIPDELWVNLKNIPHENPMDALYLAKEISEKLDTEEQLWVINWLQQHIWIKHSNVNALKKLESLKYKIQSFVNSRLAWEITLLKLIEN